MKRDSDREPGDMNNVAVALNGRNLRIPSGEFPHGGINSNWRLELTLTFMFPSWHQSWVHTCSLQLLSLSSLRLWWLTFPLAPPSGVHVEHKSVIRCTELEFSLNLYDHAVWQWWIMGKCWHLRSEELQCEGVACYSCEDLSRFSSVNKKSFSTCINKQTHTFQNRTSCLSFHRKYKPETPATAFLSNLQTSTRPAS